MPVFRFNRLTRSSLGLAVLCSAALNAGASEAGTDRVSSWIGVDKDGDLIRFSAMAEASEPLTVRYSLRIEKSSPSGHAVTSQGGSGELAQGGVARELSSVSVNVGPDSVYTVELTVEEPDGTLHKSTLSHPAN